MSIPFYDGPPPKEKDMITISVDGTEAKICSAGNGYYIKIDEHQYKLNAESLYDNTRPLKNRKGEIVYVSELYKKHSQINDKIVNIIKSVIVAYVHLENPEYFIEFG